MPLVLKAMFFMNQNVMVPRPTNDRLDDLSIASTGVIITIYGQETKDYTVFDGILALR